MKVRILGAAEEVGRSGFLVDADGTNLLLDYGVMFERRGKPPRYPLHVKPKDVDSVIITHAHLDHSGNVPSLFVSGSAGVYSTQPTMELSRLLIEDMLKIEKNAHTFDVIEVNKMMRNHKPVDYRQKVSRGKATFELRESGPCGRRQHRVGRVRGQEALLHRGHQPPGVANAPRGGS